jgi:hypothetical protein
MSRLLVPLVALVLVSLSSARGAEASKEGELTVDKEKRTITIPAKIAPRKIDDPRYKEIYPVEVIATFPFPEGKKAHETVVTYSVKPSVVHKALEELGLKPGKPARTETDTPSGPEVKIYIETGTGPAARRVPIEQTLVDIKTGKKMPKVKWLFTGSTLVKPNPDKPETAYGADQSGTLIAIFPVTDETVFQSSLLLRDEKYVKLETSKTDLPAIGTAVKLVIVAPAK